MQLQKQQIQQQIQLRLEKRRLAPPMKKVWCMLLLLFVVCCLLLQSTMSIIDFTNSAIVGNVQLAALLDALERLQCGPIVVTRNETPPSSTTSTTTTTTTSRKRTLADIESEASTTASVAATTSSPRTTLTLAWLQATIVRCCSKITKVSFSTQLKIYFVRMCIFFVVVCINKIIESDVQAIVQCAHASTMQQLVNAVSNAVRPDE